jgi:hypothetical protein
MEDRMRPSSDERPDAARASDTSGAIRDRRTIPRGVLPRHVQMWLMVAIAVVIIAIILMTGQPQPTPRPSTAARPPEPTLVSPERVRSYEQALAAEAARQQQALVCMSLIKARPNRVRTMRHICRLKDENYNADRRAAGTGRKVPDRLRGRRAAEDQRGHGPPDLHQRAGRDRHLPAT